MDAHGVYGKKAEAKLKLINNPKMTLEVLDKISILAERTLKSPKNPQNHIKLADLCFEAGDYATAKIHYNEALCLLKDPAEISDVRDKLRRVNKEFQEVE